MLRPVLTAGALACALTLGACTSDQEQQVLTGLSVACSGLAVGTTIAVEVAGAVPGAAGASAVASTVQAVGGTACSALIPGVKGIVDNIIASGGTATVTATTTNPVTQQKTIRRMTVTPTGQIVLPNGGVIPPSGFRF